jgi:hypothetical protein
MTKVRASITVGVIQSLGNDTQDKAYKHLLRKENKLEEEFRKIISTAIKDANEAAIIWVFTRIVDSGFHTRLAIEWHKYQAKKTDRASGKEKKMSTREMLKPGGSVKKESD